MSLLFLWPFYLLTIGICDVVWCVFRQAWLRVSACAVRWSRVCFVVTIFVLVKPMGTLVCLWKDLWYINVLPLYSANTAPSYQMSATCIHSPTNSKRRHEFFLCTHPTPTLPFRDNSPYSLFPVALFLLCCHRNGPRQEVTFLCKGGNLLCWVNKFRHEGGNLLGNKGKSGGLHVEQKSGQNTHTHKCAQTHAGSLTRWLTQSSDANFPASLAYSSWQQATVVGKAIFCSQNVWGKSSNNLSQGRVMKQRLLPDYYSRQVLAFTQEETVPTIHTRR